MPTKKKNKDSRKARKARNIRKARKALNRVTNANEQNAHVNTHWDNPSTRSARAGMSDETADEYKRVGEEFYGGIDFENPLVQESTDAINYIKTGLRSGLMPIDLSKEEQALMENVYGPQWFIKYGGMGESLEENPTEKTRKDLDKDVERVFGLMGVKQTNFLDKLDNEGFDKEIILQT
ncbi:MAG: hypothetical protein JKX76_02100 [Colwellia sp.]|nr:hypothetical protein [Colwellia sp.]